VLGVLQREHTPRHGVAPRLYWGTFETFHWLTAIQQATGWTYGWGRRGGAEPCAVAQVPINHSAGSQSGTWERVGPFNFAKGPFFLLSLSLIRELLATGARGRVEDVMSSRRSPIEHALPPWEDVFTGFALALGAVGPGLFEVHLGTSGFSEGWGAYPRDMRRSTLVYHENVSRVDAPALASLTAFDRKHLPRL
jgi:hypothetical protein